ncbi:hypothetical protein D9615_002474 [Tricholomella constricta]|uniref:Uncharacterized protein n=1 Tax=Tricholomella constricta TaxID=117010 RepID=A0A8H5M9K5_9AGAR|nr:hypothetical protein D9615_002474 [Tricholomella constricta]
MAPTVSSGSQNQADLHQPANGLRPTFEAKQQSTGLVQCIRRAHHQRSLPKLWRRQYPATESSMDLPDPMPPAKDDDPFVPYTSTIALHANIIPLRTSAQIPGTSLSPSHLPVTEIVLIAGGALVVTVLGLAGMYMIRTIFLRKSLHILGCCGRKQRAKNGIDKSENKGVLVMGDELDDDPTWGTPTRIVYVESINEALGDHDLPEPTSLLETSPIAPSISTWSPDGQRRSPAVSEEENFTFQEQLRVEEDNINLALDLALRKIPAQAEEETPTVDSIQITEEPFPFLGHEESVSIFRSLQASIDELAKGVSSPVIQNRPRQGSDASASSQETTSPELECFSAASSESSVTSLTSTDSDFDEEELEVVYEVKRAQTQSVELKKGILVTCRRSPSVSEDILISPMLPTFVISEPAPILLPFEEQNSRGTMYSFESSLSTTASLGGCNTVPSLSSLVRENSRGTICSLATSFSTTTRTEGCDDERFLQPPIPYLMVTRPSDSSIYTTESSVSSVSVDLNEFPLPPIPIKPSYYSRLVDQVQARKRVWDNHPAGSSVAQKRSTVERFMMMYSK